MIKRLEAALSRQGGFTLIELLAVMAIVSTLAGIVSTSVSGTGESGTVAAARQDASTFVSSAGDYFADQVGAEVLTASTVTVSTPINDDTPVATEQVIGSRWPEAFIAEDNVLPGSSIYSKEFPTLDTDPDSTVINVQVTGKRDAEGNLGVFIDRHELLEGYTAIDFDKLVDDHYAVTPPESATTTTDGGFHNFLWLFRKSTSAGGSTDDDSRTIMVFKLATVEKIENSSPEQVILSYVQVH